MHAKPFFTIAVLLLISSSFSFAWLPGWSYRTGINISSTSALSDYQAAVDTTNLVYNNTGLVASWHFSEGSGTRAADSSGNANDGTLTNGPAWNSSGRAGYALQLDGVDDYVNAGNGASLNLNGNIDLTIEGWIKPPAGSYPTSDSALVSKITSGLDGYMLYFVPGGAVRLYTGSSYISSGVLPTNDGAWHHIAAVKTGSAGRIYLDGNEVSVSGSLSSIPSNSFSFTIGSQGTSTKFNGTIDEVRIYNRSLSASEIQAHYNASRLKPDYSDLRFASPADAQLPFWLESDNKAWVKVPSVPNGTSTIYAYYGNPSASPASNGTETFAFFDDFGSSIDTSKWTLTDGTGWSVANGELKGTSTTGRLTSIQTFSSGVIQEVKARRITASFIGVLAGFWLSTTDGFGFLQHPPNGVDYYRNDGAWVGMAATAPASTNLLVRISVKSPTNVDLSVTNYATGTSYQSVLNVANAISSEPIVIGKWYDNTNTGNGLEAYWDLIRVRKYASTEPTTSALAEEEALQFAYRKTILLSNAGPSLTDYQVNLTIDTAALVSAGKMKSDCADLRFTDATSYNTQDWAVNYKYWIESGCNTSATRLWVKVPSIPNGTSTLYAYYGNSSALPASNGANTFDFFDDATGIYSEKWTTISGGAGSYNTVAGKKAIVLSGSSLIRTLNYQSGNNISIEANSWGSSTDTLNQVGYFQDSTPTGNERYSGRIDFRTCGTCYEQITKDSTQLGSAYVLTKPISTWLKMKITSYAGSHKNYVNDALGGSGTDTTYASGYLVLNQQLSGAGYFNDIRVRKLSSPEPTASLGTEQQPDTTAPSVSIQSPNSTPYASSTVPVNFTATDNIGISSCTVRLNGTINSSTCSNYTLNLANGAYLLNVSANDTAGNVNSSQVPFTVAVTGGGGQQSNSTSATTDANGIAAGNVSFTFIPAILQVQAGNQAPVQKTISASPGVSRIELRARLTLSGQAAPGKQVTYTISG